MKNLVWSSAFVRAFKRLVRQNPQLRSQVEETLKKLADTKLRSVLVVCG
ncbi:hypothetical protein [Brasilonema bromeliae]|nr:hypothetical protein [Brasilonema bromeliae]